VFSRRPTVAHYGAHETAHRSSASLLLSFPLAVPQSQDGLDKPVLQMSA
jgi:hypothetical protein